MPNKNSDISKKMKELEEIVEWFEQDNDDIDKSLEKFESGMKLAEELKASLKDVENKVEKIKSKYQN